MQDKKNICEDCGTVNDINSEYCLFCGNYIKFSDKNNSNIMLNEEGKPKKYSILGFLALFCFLCAASLTLGIYGFIGSLIIFILYVIFGNSKVIKTVLYFVCGAFGLVFVGCVLLVVVLVIWFFVNLITFTM